MDIDKLGVSFSTNFIKVHGNGSSIKFWMDSWRGPHPLYLMFKCLFALETQKDYMVNNCIVWEDFGMNWCWRWGHAPRGRTLDELTNL